MSAAEWHEAVNAAVRALDAAGNDFTAMDAAHLRVLCRAWALEDSRVPYVPEFDRATDEAAGKAEGLFRFESLPTTAQFRTIRADIEKNPDDPTAWKDSTVSTLASVALQFTQRDRDALRVDDSRVVGLEELRRRLEERYGVLVTTYALVWHEWDAQAARQDHGARPGTWVDDKDAAEKAEEEYARKVQEELVRLRARRDAEEHLRQEEADASGVRSIREMAFTAEQFATMDAPDPLVKGVLDAGALAEMVGTRATAKTFVALDMALAVATGTPWAKHSTVRGRVLYLVGEGGGRAFGIRLEAWCRKHGVNLPDLREWFVGMDGAVPFMSSRWDELVEFAADYRPALVVVDTLGRHSTGMDENSNSDAHRAVELVKALQDRTGAAVMLLHHPAKGGSAAKVNSGRGAGAWEGAADAVFGLERDGDERTPLTETSVEMVCTKQKHRPDGQVWTFTFETVEVTPNGTWNSSLVPALTDPLEVPAARAAQAVADAKATAVEEWLVDAVETNPGHPATRYYRANGLRRMVAVQGREVAFSVNEAKAAVDRLVASGRLVMDVVNPQKKLLRLPDETPSDAAQDPR
ncbi:AAA family ATPase [Rhodococcus pyridinivorans]